MGFKALIGVLILDAMSFFATALDVDTLLNVLTIAVAALVAYPLIRSRRKDGAIKDLEIALSSKDALAAGLQTDLLGAERRANLAEEGVKHMRVEVADLRARYEEQSKYTAEPAILHIEQEFRQHMQQVSDRHERMLVVLEQIVTRLDSLEQTRRDDLDGPHG